VGLFQSELAVLGLLGENEMVIFGKTTNISWLHHPQ
jgi:hypothetical protein